MDFTLAHQHLIALLKEEGISHPSVLDALRFVPRHAFVTPENQEYAYENRALSNKKNQTISQPYMVAQMTQLLLGEKNHLDKVLEIGTGSGYQSAILSKISNAVYTLERIESLLEEARLRFNALQIKNILSFHQDGSLGLPEYAPFDGIIVTAAAPNIPETLKQQLAEKGKLIIPIGDHTQQVLCSIQRKNNDFEIKEIEPVRFVPLLTGKE